MLPILLCINIAVAAIIIAAVAVPTYNRLVARQAEAENSFSQIEVQLKRRYDLIPALVDSVRGYLTHESETLEAVMEARSKASSSLSGVRGNLADPDAVGNWAASEAMLGGMMGRMAAVIEAYPELKGSDHVADLTEELTSTENRIAFARQLFNDNVTTFNVKRRSLPTVLFASLMGFDRDLQTLSFDDQPEIYVAPRVDLTLQTAS